MLGNDLFVPLNVTYSSSVKVSACPKHVIDLSLSIAMYLLIVIRHFQSSARGASIECPCWAVRTLQPGSAHLETCWTSPHIAGKLLILKPRITDRFDAYGLGRVYPPLILINVVIIGIEITI